MRGDRRLSATRTLPLLLAAVLLACAAGCGGNKKSAATTTTTPAADSLFSGIEPGVTFADARTAIRKLYASHPEIRRFVYQDVYYTPATRNQVLAVCKRGGPATNAREKETSRVFGCAPLIFFFYSFGKRKHVTESTDVARSLYVYASAIPGPYSAQPQLTSLLRSWGVR
jgi:hypothetical protein